MNYRPTPNSKETPSRKQRKAERTRNFVHNKGLAPKMRREKRLARKAAEEAALENVEE